MVTLEERWAIDDRAPLPKASEGIQSGCAVCGTTEHLQTCSGCHVISYCGRDHQIAHRQAHRFVCNGVKRSMAALEAAEAHEQENTPDRQARMAMSPLQHLLDTDRRELFSKYQQSPLHVFLRRINTVKASQALQRYLERCNTLLGINCFDFHIASLEASARLGQDQKLYDTIKSLCIFQQVDRIFHNENVFEAPDFMIQPHDSFWYHRILDFLILMTWFKVKLVLDLMNLKGTRVVLDPYYREETIDRILMNIPKSHTVKSNGTIMANRDLTAQIESLDFQITTLVREVHDRNEYFWVKLASHDPNEIMTERPTPEELADKRLGQAKDLLLCHVYYWFQIQGAIDILKQKIDPSQ